MMDLLSLLAHDILASITFEPLIAKCFHSTDTPERVSSLPQKVFSPTAVFVRVAGTGVASPREAGVYAERGLMEGQNNGGQA